jgi:hypothetical protein
MVYQIEQTLGYDPMRWAPYERAMGSDQNSHLNERKLTERFTGYDSRLAKRLGVRMVVSGAPIDTILPREAYDSLTFLGPLGDAYLYQNADVAPRAVVAPLGKPDEAKAAAGSIIMIPDTSPDDAPLGQAEIVSYHQSQVVVRVKLEKPGLLILHDIYHPAWKAWRGSEPVPVLRANGLFRAVALPAGEHTVTFSFEPLSWSELVEAANRVIAATDRANERPQRSDSSSFFPREKLGKSAALRGIRPSSSSGMKSRFSQEMNNSTTKCFSCEKPNCGSVAPSKAPLLAS